MFLTRRMKYLWFRQKKVVVVCVILIGVLYTVFFGWRRGRNTEPEVHTPACAEPEIATLQTDLQRLIHVLKDPNERQAYAWMRMRVERMWQKWTKAIYMYSSRSKIQHRRRKKILVFIGALTKESRRNLAEHQFKGGYLGELLQWSDLVSGLYLLGHDVTLISETAQLQDVETFFDDPGNGCGTSYDLSLIYTDVFGLRHMLRKVQKPYKAYKCRLRVLDVFGTDPAWNDKMYAAKHNRTTFWAGFDINTRQYYTMYPENPDNSFLGFAVDAEIKSGREVAKDYVALVYGKLLESWKDKTDYLKVFDDAGFSLHATVKVDNSDGSSDTPVLPTFIYNMGVLKGDQLNNFLPKVKVFIGLGTPVEGPAPLEALANGAVYINPKFDAPVNLTSRRRTTERFFTSQTPYTEVSVGEPHVYTVNINDLEKVRAIADTLMERNSYRTFLPYEYTQEGFLQRLNVYIEKQSFCREDIPKWPPKRTVSYHVGFAGESCVAVCNNKGLRCEPDYFSEANTLTNFKDVTCAGSRLAADIYYPALDLEPGHCVIQRNPNLFSCAGSSSRFKRLCPCRDFMKQQRALCALCDL